MSSKAKLVPCGGIAWDTLYLFEPGDEVIVKQMKGTVERIDGDFYTIVISPGHSIMAHYSELRASRGLKRPPQHWLVGRDVLIIHDNAWKGSRGVVTDVSFPEAHSSPQDEADHIITPSQETRGVALVQIVSQSVFFGSASQLIPFRNIALDLRTEP